MQTNHIAGPDCPCGPGVREEGGQTFVDHRTFEVAHDNADTLVPREGRQRINILPLASRMYNFDYVCRVSGHIMDKWYPKSGPPKASVRRVCVIPTCAYIEEKEAKA